MWSQWINVRVAVHGDISVLVVLGGCWWKSVSVVCEMLLMRRRGFSRSISGRISCLNRSDRLNHGTKMTGLTRKEHDGSSSLLSLTYSSWPVKMTRMLERWLHVRLATRYPEPRGSNPRKNFGSQNWKDGTVEGHWIAIARKWNADSTSHDYSLNYEDMIKLLFLHCHATLSVFTTSNSIRGTRDLIVCQNIDSIGR